MRARVLTLAVTAVLVLATPHPASTAPKRLAAQLGFIVFCRTSMTDVTARLGPGALVAEHPNEVWRGWYDAASRVYLFVVRRSDDFHKGLPGAPPVVQVALAAESHKPAVQVKTLARPRLSLTSLRGPNGIRLGDSRERVLRLLGRGESLGRSGNIETYNYYNIHAPVPREGCGVAGLILQVSFTGGRLTSISILEVS